MSELVDRPFQPLQLRPLFLCLEGTVEWNRQEEKLWYLTNNLHYQLQCGTFAHTWSLSKIWRWQALCLVGLDSLIFQEELPPPPPRAST